MSSSNGRASILLVDSVQDNREMFAAFLADEQFAVLEAATTNEALCVAPNADVIVTGIQVDGTFDGVELVRQLRHGEKTYTKPVIVLTACTLESDKHRARMAGCDRFLRKPCLPETLLNAIEDLLTKERELRAEFEYGHERSSDAMRNSKKLMENSNVACQRSQDLLDRIRHMS